MNASGHDGDAAGTTGGSPYEFVVQEATTRESVLSRLATLDGSPTQRVSPCTERTGGGHGMSIHFDYEPPRWRLPGWTYQRTVEADGRVVTIHRKAPSMTMATGSRSSSTGGSGTSARSAPVRSQVSSCGSGPWFSAARVELDDLGVAKSSDRPRSARIVRVVQSRLSRRLRSEGRGVAVQARHFGVVPVLS